MRAQEVMPASTASTALTNATWPTAFPNCRQFSICCRGLWCVFVCLDGAFQVPIATMMVACNHLRTLPEAFTWLLVIVLRCYPCFPGDLFDAAVFDARQRGQVVPSKSRGFLRTSNPFCTRPRIQRSTGRLCHYCWRRGITHADHLR